MAKDITEQLKGAKILIKNLIASHQSTAPMAARHAVRVFNLPPDLLPSLNEFANQLEKTTK